MFFLILGLILNLPTFSKNSAVITRVKLNQNKESSKVEIRLTEPIYKPSDVMASLQTVSFDLNATLPQKKRKTVKNGKVSEEEYVLDSKDFINRVLLRSNKGQTTVEIKRQYFTPVNLIEQENPPAIIVEFPRDYFQKESVELKPGIKKHLVRTVNSRGPIVLHLLEVDLSNEKISFKVGMPDDGKLKAKGTLSQIVKKQKAFAGINANYFDVKVGNPIGTLIRDATWITGPVYDRVAIGFSDDNMVFIDQVMLIGNATAYRGFRKKPKAMIEIDGLNTALNLYNKVGLFTKDWDEKIDLPKGKIALLIKNDSVKEIEDEKIEVPNDGFVIVGHKDYLGSVKKKDQIEVEWMSKPDWSEVKEAVSGGPYLIMGGEVYVDQEQQRFKYSVKETFAPRSAIGLGNDGKLYLIAVDGRMPNYSAGLTLHELAQILKKLDFKEVINLDGGGSTTLVADGGIINTLSERHERKISNALLIFYK